MNDHLYAKVSRGKNKGRDLFPHIQNGHYIISPTRFERDYTFFPRSEALEPYLKRGSSCGCRLRASHQA